MKKVKVFVAGVEGGGFSVYRNDTGQVFEDGSSGGMLDEDEDPIIEWSKTFESWEIWWEDFKQTHGDFWVAFYPLFIHESIAVSIEKDLVAAFHKDNDNKDRIRSWFMTMNKPFEL